MERFFKSFTALLMAFALLVTGSGIAYASSDSLESSNYLTGSSGTIYTTYKSAGAYLAECMAKRMETIEVIFEPAVGEKPDKGLSEAKTIMNRALDASLDSTGKYGDSLEFGYNDCNSSVRSLGNQYIITYKFVYYSTAAQEEALTKAINAALSELNLSGKSDFQKIKAIHDYICKKVTYDEEHLSDCNYFLQYTAYAALVKGTSVCQGYAILFYRMCKQSGIDARIIGGLGYVNGRAQNHAWNLVELNGKWYNVDCTWDDGKTGFDYDYFLKSNNGFRDHARASQYATAEFNSKYPMSASDYKLPHTHKLSTKVTRATTAKNGKIIKKCTGCDYTTTSTINRIKTVKLSAKKYTYNGKVKTPAVTVTDIKGKRLVKGKDYTVSYSKGRKNVGKYTVKVTFKGNYAGSHTMTYTIIPKSASISSVLSGSKKMTVRWKKQTVQTNGYQIQYSTSNKFSKAKTVTIKSNKTTSKVIKNLSGKKKYYVRIRTYKTVSGKKYYSNWSKAKYVITKK